MALGPDLDALDALVKRRAGGPLEPVYSFVSLTELSEYTSTEDEERARLEAEGAPTSRPGWASGGPGWRPTTRPACTRACPPRAMIAFYPMSKRRDEGANWYELSFEERKRLMGGHARVGRRYAGRILQLITGATGLDDWEWGVTLLADDPAAIKEIVYEMRFDEVSRATPSSGPSSSAWSWSRARRSRAPASLVRGLSSASSTRSIGRSGRASASSTGQWRSTASASSP